MPEGAADRGERDTGVAARRLGDDPPGPQITAAVGLLQDVERHPVLDAPREVDDLVLGIHRESATLIATAHLDERGPADEPSERREALGDRRSERQMRCRVASAVSHRRRHGLKVATGHVSLVSGMEGGGREGLQVERDKDRRVGKTCGGDDQDPRILTHDGQASPRWIVDVRRS